MANFTSWLAESKSPDTPIGPVHVFLTEWGGSLHRIQVWQVPQTIEEYSSKWGWGNRYKKYAVRVPKRTPRGDWAWDVIYVTAASEEEALEAAREAQYSDKEQEAMRPEAEKDFRDTLTRRKKVLSDEEFGPAFDQEWEKRRHLTGMKFRKQYYQANAVNSLHQVVQQIEHLGTKNMDYIEVEDLNILLRGYIEAARMAEQSGPTTEEWAKKRERLRRYIEKIHEQMPYLFEVPENDTTWDQFADEKNMSPEDREHGREEFQDHRDMMLWNGLWYKRMLDHEQTLSGRQKEAQNTRRRSSYGLKRAEALKSKDGQPAIDQPDKLDGTPPSAATPGPLPTSDPVVSGSGDSAPKGGYLGAGKPRPSMPEDEAEKLLNLYFDKNGPHKRGIKKNAQGEPVVKFGGVYQTRENIKKALMGTYRPPAPISSSDPEEIAGVADKLKNRKGLVNVGGLGQSSKLEMTPEQLAKLAAGHKPTSPARTFVSPEEFAAALAAAGGGS